MTTPADDTTSDEHIKTTPPAMQSADTANGEGDNELEDHATGKEQAHENQENDPPA